MRFSFDRFLPRTCQFIIHYHNVQTGSGAYPASPSMGIGGSFPRGNAAGAWSSQLTSI